MSTPAETISETIKVLLVEDHGMLLDAIGAALSGHPSVELVAIAASFADAATALRSTDPDVVVTDLRLGDGLGTDLVSLAGDHPNAPPVLLITGAGDEAGVSEALTSGCAGFVSKSQSFDRLVDAIQAVARGASVFPADLLRDTLRPNATALGNDLSVRELEVLQLLAEAHSAKQIASDLFLSENTVRNYIAQVLTKLRAHSQLEAVVIAVRHGLVSIS